MKVSEKQAGHNTATRSQWEFFESHRLHTTANICEARNGLPTVAEPTLAVLGAGNGNDLDLPMIAKSFSKIHLFDFDPVALEHLRSQQLSNPFVANSVIIEPPVDLSGIFTDLDDLPEAMSEPDVLKLGDKARAVEHVLPGQQFDVVASTSLTTQLLGSVVDAFGDGSPFKNFMMLAIRDGHLKLMEKMIRPGGRGVLVCDFVSSDTLPELVGADTEETVLALARKAIDERNFFTGTNPWFMKEALGKLITEDPNQPVSIAPPWRWRMGESRFYAVTSVGFSKP